jgi:hypothetical protein
MCCCSNRQVQDALQMIRCKRMPSALASDAFQAQCPPCWNTPSSLETKLPGQHMMVHIGPVSTSMSVHCPWPASKQLCCSSNCTSSTCNSLQAVKPRSDSSAADATVRISAYVSDIQPAHTAPVTAASCEPHSCPTGLAAKACSLLSRGSAVCNLAPAPRSAMLPRWLLLSCTAHAFQILMSIVHQGASRIASRHPPPPSQQAHEFPAVRSSPCHCVCGAVSSACTSCAAGPELPSGYFPQVRHRKCGRSCAPAQTSSHRLRGLPPSPSRCTRPDSSAAPEHLHASGECWLSRGLVTSRRDVRTRNRLMQRDGRPSVACGPSRTMAAEKQELTQALSSKHHS